MAKPEQTEKPTAKRIDEARKRGQVARSPDIASAAIFLVAVFVLHSNMLRTVDLVSNTLHATLDHIHQQGGMNTYSVWWLFMQDGRALAPLGATLFGASVLIAILANVAQFGFLFTLQPITPSFGKLNPISGFQNLFSKQSVVSLLKQLLKLGAVGVIMYSSIVPNLDFFAAVGQATPAEMVNMTADLVYTVAWKFGMFLVVIGILDYLYQRWQLEESLKMSKNEIKDEMRQSEGNPEAKGALKRKQREFARRRMMNAVPRATVVVTNPTHFAIALEWDEEKMDAPVVTAKGADLVAKRIRDIAREHGVPIMENPPLARTLYEHVELDQAIPPNLYAAVAQVIAFVYKLKNRTIA